MNKDWIYLDYNASTPLDPKVVEVMRASLEYQGHPSSPHPHGRGAAEQVELARDQVARAIKGKAEEIVFGSGSTEAANHVIKGTAFQEKFRGKPLHFISSQVDHAATVKTLEFLKNLGHQVTFLRADQHGQIDPDEVEAAIQANTALVTLIHGQNEVGTVQPLEAVGAICKQRDVLFHVDASQSFGKVDIDVQSLNADFLNIAAHKIYGPNGVGALYVRQGRVLEPLLHGGGHERGWRSGTPAPQLIAGLGQACQLVEEKGLLNSEACDILWSSLSESLGDRVQRNGHPEHRLPNVLHISFHQASGRELLNQAKISASTGAACHSASVSPVLSAMGLTPELARGSVRLSSGRYTSPEVAKDAANRLIKSYQELKV